jgi:GAF domain-containing protein
MQAGPTITKSETKNPAAPKATPSDTECTATTSLGWMASLRDLPREHGFEPLRVDRASMPKKAIGQVVATAMPFVVPDAAAYPLFEPADLAALGADKGGIVSFIGVPIRNGFKVVGTLTIDRAFDPHSTSRLDFDVRFLVMIANLIGQRVELHQMLARDRDRLIAESHRPQKLALKKPARAKRVQGPPRTISRPRCGSASRIILVARRRCITISAHACGVVSEKLMSAPSPTRA